jgi:lipid A 3-O-deacylase
VTRPNVPGACLGLGLALAVTVPAPAGAADAPGHSGRTLAIGVLAHDRGPASDRHEDGIDLGVELQFAPLDVFTSPRPHLGFMLNFEGDTSVAYAGLNFRLREAPAWFVDAILGVAVHDGPLHKDPAGCVQFSDCGFGTRFLPRFGLEIGYRASADASVSLLFDHMSHKWIVSGENEGLDHVGLRYLRAF